LSAVPVPQPAQRRRRAKPISTAQRSTFLEALGAGWAATHAAQRSGVHVRRWYELRDEDEAFATDWLEALDRGADVLEDELHRRALEGWDEDQFDGDGKLIRRVRRYSPALLIFSLKARRPGKFRDSARLEVVGRSGGPIELAAGYQPPLLADMVELAASLGVPIVGYQRAEVIDGEVLELPEATS
jgi:hypothetical protein